MLHRTKASEVSSHKGHRMLFILLHDDLITQRLKTACYLVWFHVIRGSYLLRSTLLPKQLTSDYVSYMLRAVNTHARLNPCLATPAILSNWVQPQETPSPRRKLMHIRIVILFGISLFFSSNVLAQTCETRYRSCVRTCNLTRDQALARNNLERSQVRIRLNQRTQDQIGLKVSSAESAKCLRRHRYFAPSALPKLIGRQPQGVALGYSISPSALKSQNLT